MNRFKNFDIEIRDQRTRQSGELGGMKPSKLAQERIIYQEARKNMVYLTLIVVVKKTFRLQNVFLRQHLCRHPFFGTLL
jgi:hypothetical protein